MLFGMFEILKLQREVICLFVAHNYLVDSTAYNFVKINTSIGCIFRFIKYINNIKIDGCKTMLLWFMIYLWLYYGAIKTFKFHITVINIKLPYA